SLAHSQHLSPCPSFIFLLIILGISFFFFQCSAAHRDLHSFPTRRSSDLASDAAGGRRLLGQILKAAGTLREGQIQSALAEQRKQDRKSTRLNSSHLGISYAVFCLKKKKNKKK